MPVTMFMQEHSGDYNYEGEFASREAAVAFLSYVQKDGGYFLDARGIYVPWHRVDFVRIED